MRPFASTHRLLHYGAKKERLPLIHAAQKPLLSRTHPGPALVQRQHTRDSEVFSLRQPAREAPAAMFEGPRPTRCVVTTSAAVRRPRCSCHALLATATMLPSAVRAARRRSTSRARGERANDVEMGSTKLHRVRSGQRHTQRSGGRWLGERRFARWRPNLGGHVSSLAAYPGKRSIWGSSPDPYDSAGADGDLSIINHGYSDTSRHLIEKGLVIHRFRPERDFGRDLSTRVPSHVPHAVTCGRVHSDRTIASLAWERCINRRKKRWTRGLVDSLGQFENRTEYIGQFQACCE